MRNVTLRNSSILICVLFGATHLVTGATGSPDIMQPCPSSPNCVSSFSKDKVHYVEPLRFAGSRDKARQKLIEILENFRRTRLVKVEKDHIQVEFRSLIFRFVDDVEFYFPADESIIHVKSASRSGYYDFGANRRRVERLRAAF